MFVSVSCGNVFLVSPPGLFDFAMSADIVLRGKGEFSRYLGDSSGDPNGIAPQSFSSFTLQSRRQELSLALFGAKTLTGICIFSCRWPSVPALRCLAAMDVGTLSSASARAYIEDN